MAFKWKKNDNISELIRESRGNAKEVLENVPNAPKTPFIHDRRKNYKGSRAQLLLRVQTELKRDIELVAFAQHIPQNELCVNIIHEAVSLYLDRLKDDPKWTMIEAAFKFYREED
jgi:predicted HicB family RNase H-like nuclease